jgi:hypothetical protein
LDLGRMATVSEPLAREVATYDERRLRHAAASVVRLGVTRAPIQDTRLEAALANLAAGEWGDGPVRDALGVLIEELDEHAWDAQDAAERGDVDDSAYDLAFARARVATAVDCALDADPLQAALESAYEVQAGIDDLPSVAAALRLEGPT